MSLDSEQAATTQPSPGADGQPPAGSSEGQGTTGDSLESLLAEYSPRKPAPSAPEPSRAEPAKPPEGEKPASPAFDPQKLDTVLRAADTVTRFEQRQAEAQLKEDIGSAVKAVKEHDDLKGLPDRMVRGMLHDMAAEDARFREAFMRRDQDPAAWSRVLKAAAQEMAKEVGDISSSKISSDRAAVLAAGKSSSKAPPPQQTTNTDLSKMSDAQFRRWKQGHAAEQKAPRR